MLGWRVVSNSCVLVAMRLATNKAVGNLTRRPLSTLTPFISLGPDSRPEGTYRQAVAHQAGGGRRSQDLAGPDEHVAVEEQIPQPVEHVGDRVERGDHHEP